MSILAALVELVAVVSIALTFAFASVLNLFFWLWPINDKAPGKFHWVMMIFFEAVMIGVFFRLMETL